MEKIVMLVLQRDKIFTLCFATRQKLGNVFDEKKKFCANVFTCHVKDNLCLDCLRFACKKFPTTGLRDGYDDENFNQSLVVSKKLHQLKVLREAGSHEPGWKTE